LRAKEKLRKKKRMLKVQRIASNEVDDTLIKIIIVMII
jgi:hypothetical protein